MTSPTPMSADERMPEGKPARRPALSWPPAAAGFLFSVAVSAFFGAGGPFHLCASGAQTSSATS
jgi:hypothetical protein